MNQTSLANPNKPKRIDRALPQVVIVGCPNVGKSTLFNALIGKRKAITQDDPGTTRDRNTHETTILQTKVLLVDTGGYQISQKGELVEQVNQEVERAIRSAALLLFVCDGREGLKPYDEFLAKILRPFARLTILVVNKIDHEKIAAAASEFYQLGFDRLIPVSALHKTGIGLLSEAIASSMSSNQILDELLQDRPSFVATLAGEPNVGKSTYFNRLLNEERAIVSDIPGTTRDSIQEAIEYLKWRIYLYDTAGVRKKKSIRDPTSFFSVSRTREAIRHSEVVLFIFDTQRGITSTAKELLSFVADQNKACVLLVNKWDLMKGVEQGKYKNDVYSDLPFLSPYPLAFVSALKEVNVSNPLDLAIKAYENYTRWIKTSELNRWLGSIKNIKSVRFKINLKYITQIGVRPPSFALFAGRMPIKVSRDTVKFLENQLRSNFDLTGSPIQIQIRGEQKA